MKHFTLLFALVLAFPFLSQAQIIRDTCPCLHQDSTIKNTIIHHGKYSSVVYSMNNEVLSNKELKSILDAYPASAAEMKKFRGQNLVASLMLSSFVAFVTVGSIQAGQQKKAPGSNFEKAPLPFSISLASLFGSVIVWGNNRHFHKAIKVYNNRSAAL
jgi:hypothetical protein